ncbi:hypothetical protein B0H14DRAFT_2554254 [Mycena olivaceomarginata]|nr:hypothetical protein B0H14DRAFT_2554254 [Mycena olivaceomarginata]
MDDGEQVPLHAVLHADHTVLVATTLATLFLAGSALICRSGRRLSSPQGYSLASGASQADSESKRQAGDDSAKNNARSKERRRRGKDPLKDILKGGKKLKMLTVSRDLDTGSSAATSAAPSPLPLIPESSDSQRSASVSTSSRSVSSSTAAAALGMTDIHPRGRDSEDADAITTATSVRKPRGRAQKAATSPPDPVGANPDGELLRGISEMPETPISTGDSGSSSSTVLLAPSSQAQPSSSYPAHYVPAPNPWDWDGQSSSASSSGAGESAAYRKPPRFRSKSPFVSSSSSTPSRPSASSVSSSDDATFPTLNRAPSGSGTPRRVPTPRNPNSAGRASPASGGSETLTTQTQLASLRGALEAARMREDKARGELERYAKDVEMMRWENDAWRRREAELQGQIHHLMHQLHGYAALFHAQTHNHQPHQHMQNGSSSSGSSSSHPQSPNGQYVPGPSPYPAPSPNGYPLPAMFSPPLLSPGQPQQPYFAYPMPMPPPPPPPPPPAPSVQPPHQPTLFSMLFPGAASVNEGRSASGSAKGSGSVSGSSVGSGSGSGSGSPDVHGSPAPPPGRALTDRGRRRTRTQTAEARLGLEIGTGKVGWEGEMGEGWVGVDHEHDGTGELPEYDGPEQDEHDRQEGEYDGDGYEGDESYDYGYGYEDDEGFSDVLADAILKRPESIRVRSRPKQRERDGDQPPTEFTFPSLSDFGPGVHQGGGGYLDQRRDGNVGDVAVVQAEEVDVSAGTKEGPVLPAPLENANLNPNGDSSSGLAEESQS